MWIYTNSSTLSSFAVSYISLLAMCQALGVTTHGSKNLVQEFTSDLVLVCHATMTHPDDELTKVTWYFLPTNSRAPVEIFSVNPAGEHPAFIFYSKWADRGMMQPMNEGDANVVIALPARFVSRKEAGTYRCQVQSSMSRSFADVRVTVQYGPGTSLDISPDSHVERDEGEKLLLSCSAYCMPPCSYRWFKSGKSISSSSSLHLSSTSRDDAGLYACQAYNNVGRSIKPVDVRIRSRARISALSVTTVEIHPILNDGEVSKRSNTGLDGHKHHNLTHVHENKPTRSPFKYFSVTLACNVSGWPQPGIEWVVPNSNIPDDMIPSRKQMKFSTDTLNPSLHETVGLAYMKHASCINNGEYMCKITSLQSGTTAENFSKSVVLDLPCPPSEIMQISAAKVVKIEDPKRPTDEHKINHPPLTLKTIDLCLSSHLKIDVEGDVNVVIVPFDRTVTLTGCFIGSPKPFVSLRQLSHQMSKQSSKSPLAETENSLHIQSERQKQKRSADFNPFDLTETRHVTQNASSGSLSDKGNVLHSDNTAVKGHAELASVNLLDIQKKNGLKVLSSLSQRKIEERDLYPLPVLKSTPVFCSNKSSSNVLCVVEISVDIIQPNQYGFYQLHATNIHGEAHKLFRLMASQPPIRPQQFQLNNASLNKACFSWLPSFNGGAEQVFQVHVCRDDSQTNIVSDDHIFSSETCKHAIIHDPTLPTEKMWHEHSSERRQKKEAPSVCVEDLLPSTSYIALLNSKNKHGISPFGGKVCFKTDDYNDFSLRDSTNKPLTSKGEHFLIGPSPTLAPEPPFQISQISEGFLRVPLSIINKQTGHKSVYGQKDGHETPSSSDFQTFVTTVTKYVDEFDRRGELEEETYLDDSDIIIEERKEGIYQGIESSNDESEDVDDLLFDEDDLILGEINDLFFFHFFDPNMHIVDVDDKFENDNNTDSHQPKNLKDKVGKSRRKTSQRNKSASAPLLKLFSKYVKSRKTVRRELSNTPGLNTMNWASYTTSESVTSQTESPDIASEEGKHNMLDIFSTSAAVSLGLFAAGLASSIIIMIGLCACHRRQQRKRRLEQLKQRYLQRYVLEQQTRNQPNPRRAVQNETSSPCTIQQISYIQTTPPNSEIIMSNQGIQSLPNERLSVTCVSNDNAVIFQDGLQSQRRPFEHRTDSRCRKDIPETHPQRMLRQTISSPQEYRVNSRGENSQFVNQSDGGNFSDNSVTGFTKRQLLKVPTITIAEYCDLPSVPSYLELHGSFDYPISSGLDNGQSYPADPFRGRLRPPSHHSSYTSVQQSPLLRLDSSSSGTTANYFNLYDALGVNNNRSRSPSNVYDPLTFNEDGRCGTSSRCGSHTDLAVCSRKNNNDSCIMGFEQDNESWIEDKASNNSTGIVNNCSHKNDETLKTKCEIKPPDNISCCKRKSSRVNDIEKIGEQILKISNNNVGEGDIASEESKVLTNSDDVDGISVVSYTDCTVTPRSGTLHHGSTAHHINSITPSQYEHIVHQSTLFADKRRQSETTRGSSSSQLAIKGKSHKSFDIRALLRPNSKKSLRESRAIKTGSLNCGRQPRTSAAGKFGESALDHLRECAKFDRLITFHTSSSGLPFDLNVDDKEEPVYVDIDEEQTPEEKVHNDPDS